MNAVLVPKVWLPKRLVVVYTYKKCLTLPPSGSPYQPSLPCTLTYSSSLDTAVYTSRYAASDRSKGKYLWVEIQIFL
jgi:hypothetical protein